VRLPHQKKDFTKAEHLQPLVEFNARGGETLQRTGRCKSPPHPQRRPLDEVIPDHRRQSNAHEVLKAKDHPDRRIRMGRRQLQLPGAPREQVTWSPPASTLQGRLEP
jgi:hypothetical protein